MHIIDVLHSPWAILPETLEEIVHIYATHLRGDKIDVEAIEAKLGKPLQNEQRPYEVRDGVAIIGIDGVIAKRMNLFSRISGGASTQMIESDFKAAMADPEVKAIMLVIDSPGGTVDGPQQLARTIYEARGKKPITALADGRMASAAYWIGAAADKVFIASDTTLVGSIGVIATHVDLSVQNALQGKRVTEITAGKFKAAGSPNSPLDSVGRAVMQDVVDHIYSVFVNEVATFRGKTPEAVQKDMADGRIFIGQKAVDAGLVDGVATFERTLAALVSDASTAISAGAVAPEINAEEEAMEQVKIGSAMCKTQEEVDAAFTAAIATAKKDGQAEARQAGATAECERIKGIEANTLPGHDDLVKAAKFDGKTTGEQLAAQIVAAEQKKRAETAQNLAKDAPKPAPAAAAPETPATVEDKRTPMQLAKAAQKYQTAQKKLGHEISASEAVAYVTAHPEGNAE